MGKQWPPLSSQLPSASGKDKEKPILIAGHGFGGTPYEWDELCEYLESNSSVRVSQVLLGGHGSSFAVLEKSSWEEWGEPLLREYHALSNKGYRSIHWIGCSTSCALIAYYLWKRQIAASEKGTKVFFVDPFLKLRSPMFKWLPLLKFFKSSVDMREGRTEIANLHWHPFYPTKALDQLRILGKNVESILKSGFKLPSHMDLTLYQADQDPRLDFRNTRLPMVGRCTIE